MASTYSTNLAIELIGTGDQAGTWGNTTNSNLGTLIEQSISGYVTQAVSTGTDTTITIPNGSTGVARNMYIELTGTGGASTNLIVPANKKLYFIFNNSTGAVTVKVSGQTGVSVPTGKKMVLVSNGTDIVNGLNFIADFGTNSFTVTNLTASSATITNLIATSGSITTLTGSTQTLSGNLTLSGGNLAFTSTAQRITGDMSNATLTNRLAFQSSTTNGNTTFIVLPNGTSTTSQFLAFNTADPTNSSNAGLVVTSTAIRLSSGQSGTGSYLPLTFFTSGAEQARLDTSGNLGIGTASPDVKLRVDAASPTRGIVETVRGTGSTGSQIAFSQDAVADWAIGQPAGANAFAFFSGRSPGADGTERMRLDSSGNLGLGVTPGAWLSPFRAQQIGSGIGSLALAGRTDGGDDFFIGRNVFYGGSPADFRYIGTGTATRYRCDGATHAWSIAASGTAGNTISFTQAMTLDSSGRLLVGRTTSDVNGYLTQVLGSSGFQAGLLLTYSGVGSGAIFENSSGALVFGNDNGSGTTERARITSGGDLLVGTTTAIGKLTVSDTNNRTEATSQFCLRGSGYDAYHFLDATAYHIGQNSNSRELRVYSGSSTAVGVRLTAGNNAWQTYSDERMKDIIEPIENAAQKVSTLRTVIGKYKTDAIDMRRVFMIAQDVQAVLPEAVTTDAEGMLGMAYDHIVPLLTAAIKEQQAIITALIARITALESK